MKEDYKKYVRVPPYSTKTGVKIGLLYRAPFCAHMDGDAHALQKALLKKKAKEPIHYGDWAVGITSVILLVVIVILEVFHVL